MRPAAFAIVALLASSVAAALLWHLPAGEGSLPLARAERLPPPVAGLSGVACLPGGAGLFAVGDRGDVAQVDADGRAVRHWNVGGDLEDVALLPSGDLLLLDESKARVIRFDPRAGVERGRWGLDEAALLGRQKTHRDGFEGIEFRPSGDAGQGLLHLAHQRNPAMIVVARFDPARGDRLDAAAVVERWPLEDYVEVKSIAWTPALNAFLAVADARDLLLVIAPGGSVRAEFALEGVQQEGACLDDTGTLWVADDRGKALFRIRSAAGRIAAAIRPSGRR
jgi:uncharacterized protein YjiK